MIDCKLKYRSDECMDGLNDKMVGWRFYDLTHQS